MAEQTAVLEIVSTTSDLLARLTYKYGQLIFVKDTRQLYYDNLEGRTLYQQMIFLETDEQRLKLQNQVSGLYFTKDKKEIWSWQDDNWFKITNTPSGESTKEIEYISDSPTDDMIGKYNVLYIDNSNRMWRYVDTNEWVELGLPRWEPFLINE